jgi:hypothetical protein
MSEMEPPSGVHENAFASRLKTIWRTRSPSVWTTGSASTASS